MNQETSKYLIPKRIDDPPKFLFWDFEVAIIFMTSMLFGIMSGFFVMCTLVGLVGCWGMQKVKAGQQKGYGIHLLYWHLPITLFKRTPPSSIREFIG